MNYNVYDDSIKYVNKSLVKLNNGLCAFFIIL